MFVVPLSKDIITTADGLVYRVVEYTNFKEGGPAVYAKSKDDSTLTLVYFFDIVKINKTQVEYQKDSKVFNALGKVERAQQLPQPDDEVTIKGEVKKVKSLKLKSKKISATKGMLFKTEDGDLYRIRDIDAIESALGGSDFNKKLFIEVYRDYVGI